MSRKVMSRKARINSILWRNLSKSGVRKIAVWGSFMQSGALIKDPSSILEFMLSNRLCITAPSSGGPTWEAWDEKILELIPNKGNYYLQTTFHFQQTYYHNSANHRRVHKIWPRFKCGEGGEGWRWGVFREKLQEQIWWSDRAASDTRRTALNTIRRRDQYVYLRPASSSLTSSYSLAARNFTAAGRNYEGEYAIAIRQDDPESIFEFPRPAPG